MYMSLHQQKDYSIRRAMKENYPKATTPRQVYEAQPHYARVFGATVVRPSEYQKPSPSKTVANTIVNLPTHGFLMLVTMQEIALAAASGISEGLRKPMLSAPKLQRDARMRPDAQFWIEAEKKELAQLIKMRTFDIVDLPKGCSEMDLMIQYHLKTGELGQVLEHKARICARGDNN